MPSKFGLLLSCSVMLNLFLVGSGTLFVTRHGGISFLKEQLRGSAPETLGDIYFNERRSIFSAMPKREGAIVFLGDSLTERVAWNELLQRDDIIGRGIGGEDIAEIIKNVAEVARHKPKRIFVMAGTNDIIAGKTSHEIVPLYQKLVSNLKRESPQSIVVIQSVLPMNRKAFSNDSDDVAQEKTRFANGQIAEIDKRLRGMADGKNTIYCDVAAAVKREDELDPAVTPDGIHLNAQGYLKWKKVVLPLLGGATQSAQKS